jgi:hypothetical protein
MGREAKKAFLMIFAVALLLAGQGQATSALHLKATR